MLLTLQMGIVRPLKQQHQRSTSTLYQISTHNPPSLTHIYLLPPLILRPILHPSTPHIHISTRRPRPSIRTLLPTPHLPLIHHANTATATTPLYQIIPTTALDLIQVPDARALQHGEHPSEPDATRERHGQTVRVGAGVSEEICWVCFSGFLG